MSEPPLDRTVSMAVPPESTCSKLPLLSVVSMFVPPE